LVDVTAGWPERAISAILLSMVAHTFFYAREAAKVSTEKGLDLGIPKVTFDELKAAALEKSQGARPGAGAQVPGRAHEPAASDENRPGARGGGMGRFAECESQYGAEPGAEGKPQLVIPGGEQRSGADLAKRRAGEPLKPKVAQKPLEGGLFGGPGGNQLDLLSSSPPNRNAHQRRP
jgi:hypothetical protein